LEGPVFTLASGALAQRVQHQGWGRKILVADPSGKMAVPVRSGFECWCGSAYVQSLLGRPLEEERPDGQGAIQRFERGVLRYQPSGPPSAEWPLRPAWADIWIEPAGST
jgi:hypothetical protein